MSLSINHSTSIRPLGEEHLKMFRRALGPPSREDAKIEMPPEAKLKLTLSKGTSMSTGAREMVAKQGGRLATLKEVLMDKRWIEQEAFEWSRSTHQRVFVDNLDIPSSAGYYKIDRAHQMFLPITKLEAENLRMFDRIYIFSSAIYGAQSGRVLLLRIEYGDSSISLNHGLSSEAHAAIAVDLTKGDKK